jgi:hypothetical protein
MLPTQNKPETLTWLGVFFALCGAVVWIRTATVKATYRYVQQEKELTSLASQMQEFRIKWLKLTSPKRLESMASRFDLVPPDPNQRVQYTSKGSLN